MQPRGGVSPAVAAMPCFVYSNFKRTGTPRRAASIVEGVLLLNLPSNALPRAHHPHRVYDHKPQAALFNSYVNLSLSGAIFYKYCPWGILSGASQVHNPYRRDGFIV